MRECYVCGMLTSSWVPSVMLNIVWKEHILHTQPYAKQNFVHYSPSHDFNLIKS